MDWSQDGRRGDSVPSQNVAIYRAIYTVEVALRELIIETLQERFGPLWWKHQLPADVLKAYREAIDYERRTKWCQLVPHHPIYYVDFPDLKKVILRSDNWSQAFQSVFRSSDVVTGTFAELEPIRNKVAHNRKATNADLRVVDGAVQKVANALGEDRFRALVSRCTLAEDLAGTLRALLSEAEAAYPKCVDCEPLPESQVWAKVSKAWWFDSDYLGCDVSAVSDYFGALDFYRALPRRRGSGHSIEAWVRSNDLAGRYASAVGQISALLSDGGGG